MKRLVLLSCALACGCAPHTGDALVDRVVVRVAPFASCIVVGQTRVYREGGDESAPPALLTPHAFHDPEALDAASRVAIAWRSAPAGPARFFGKGAAENCPLHVNRPVFSGEHAFVSYSEPGGTVGAISFHRKGAAWQAGEQVRLGYW